MNNPLDCWSEVLKSAARTSGQKFIAMNGDKIEHMASSKTIMTNLRKLSKTKNKTE